MTLLVLAIITLAVLFAGVTIAITCSGEFKENVFAATAARIFVVMPDV